MENNFSNVETDNKVFHIVHRWGTVTEVAKNSFRAMFTDRNNTSLSLWICFDGKCNDRDKNPAVFWDEVKIIPPQKPKRKIEKIIEGWINIYPDPLVDSRIIASTCYLYISKEDADRSSDMRRRLGEACHVIHKYTIEG